MYVVFTNKESLGMSEMRGVRASLLAILGIVVALVIVGLPLVEAQRQYDASLYSGLRWRMIGPFRGGRGRRSSTRSLSRQLGPSPSRRPIPTSFTSARAKPTCARRFPTAMECINPPTPER